MTIFTNILLIIDKYIGNMVYCTHMFIVMNITAKMRGMNEMDGHSMSERKKEIIETTWQYLLKRGLEHSSVGELCRETGVAQSSLYHYFENKDDIWISAGKYGLSKAVDALFSFTFNHTDDIQEYFCKILDEIEKYKYELRLGVQITTSPVFGSRMRDKANDFRRLYERYAGKLMGIFDCSYLQAETFIYSIIAYVIDYALWDDREKTQMLLDNLRDRVIKELNAGK